MMTKLGPFQILEVIGRGGMGTVYRGIDPIIGRPVAIKVIRLLGYNDGEEQTWLKERLFREARAAGGLNHPAIVTIYQVGEDQDVAYIAMELVDGPTLLDKMKEQSNMPALCRILNETAAALDHAHERGLVHRDIKPANIMIAASGATKVTDFGIAKMNLSQTAATQTGLILGTPFYMSPEQVRGSALDGRSDQFALAVIAYEIFTGRKPFQAEHPTSVCYQIINEEPLSPDDVNPAVGAPLAAVLKRGLSKRAEDRYPTCGQFTQALTDAYKAVSIPVPPSPRLAAPSAPAAAPRAAARAKKVPVSILAFLAPLAVVLVLFGAYRWMASPKAAPPEPGAPAPVAKATMPVAPAPKAASQEFLIVTPVPVAPAKQAPVPSTETAPPPQSATAGTVEEVRTPEARTPEVRKAGSGSIVWTGNLPAGRLITITGSRASSGSLSGALPQRPVTVQIHPAEDGAAGLTVFTSNPEYATPTIVVTPRGRANFTFDPRHATDVVVFEEPAPQNDWNRLVVQLNNPKISAFVIQWQAQ
ncbi:MAG: protein kinase [Bryobacteraceae bacterium]